VVDRGTGKCDNLGPNPSHGEFSLSVCGLVPLAQLSIGTRDSLQAGEGEGGDKKEKYPTSATSLAVQLGSVSHFPARPLAKGKKNKGNVYNSLAY